MQETMPQEIEVRYILPAIRRELARIFIEEHKLSQKEAAKILGLTEAAVSQYRHFKRAKEVVFSESVVNEIRISADRILADKNSKQRIIAEMYRISNLTKVKQILCDIHRAQSKELENCNICFDESLVTIKTGN
ncbi:MAG: transcriptional regulator [Nanoarchaeota archaeon]|nr:transcriptional regulator [Nanoarchaeota archaeon]